MHTIRFLRLGLAHLFVLFLLAPAHAADLKFDTSFGSDPNYPGLAIVPAPESLGNTFSALYLDKTSADRYLAIVNLANANLGWKLQLARINSDGSLLDATTLPTIGTAAGEILFRGSCQTSSGAVYGVTYEPARMLVSIFRLQANGEIDLAFSEDGLISRPENIAKIACYGEDLLVAKEGGLSHIDRTGEVRFLPISESIWSFGLLSDGKLYVLSATIGAIRFTRYRNLEETMLGTTTQLSTLVCPLQPLSFVQPYSAYGGNDQVAILISNGGGFGAKPAFITARVDANGLLIDPACQNATFAGNLFNEPLVVEQNGYFVFGSSRVNDRERQSMGRSQRIGISLFADQQFGNGWGISLPFEADLTQSTDRASAMVLDDRFQPSRLLLAGEARGAIANNRLTIVRMIIGYFQSSGFE
jgi:hypothetical protein